jgi:hypothetical protein
LLTGRVTRLSRFHGSGITAYLHRNAAVTATQAAQQGHGAALAWCWLLVLPEPLQGQGSIGPVEIILLAKQQAQTGNLAGTGT